MTDSNDEPTWDDKTKHDNRVAPPLPTAEEVAETLQALYKKLLKSGLVRKGLRWEDAWEGWRRGSTWLPEKKGIYVLWASARDDPVTGRTSVTGESPIYVGEGQLGPRIWESFVNRKEWNYVQVLVDDRISGDDQICRWWRKALERFVIVAVRPRENRD